MATGKRSWRMVLAGMVIAVLAAVGLVVAQNQQPAVPAGPSVIESVTEAPAKVAEVPADIPRLTPAQLDFESIRKSNNLFAGSTLAGEKDSAQERAAAAQAFAAEEAAAPRESQASGPLPFPIQVADEVTTVVDELRGIARQLDLIAANDEDAANYVRADRLRRSAARIRREARGMRAE